MLKTYAHDYEYVIRLLKTFKIYNKDGIILFLVCPLDDTELFGQLVKDNEGVYIVAEENIPVEYAPEDVNGITKGYINQEIVKLGFWKTELSENYLCIDSDAYFIRDFYYRDFMYDEDVPYTCLYEDNDLKCSPQYYHGYWSSREKQIKKIAQELQYTRYHLLTCHGFQTFSAIVLQNFEEQYLRAKGYSYLDIVKIAPYEFTWYNFWLQKTNIIPIYICEPQFKTYHMAYQQMRDVMFGIKESDLSRSYVGVIMNSNYCKAPISFSDYRKIVYKNDAYIRYGVMTYMCVQRLITGLQNLCRVICHKVSGWSGKESA